MRFGFNDLGGDLTPLLHDYRPSAWVTFDGGRARWLADTFPEALVIYRHYPDDNDLHLRRRDAVNWYHEARKACGLDNRVIIQCGNEPVTDLGALADWTCAVIEAANADGGTVAVCGFSTGLPVSGTWPAELLPILRKLAGSRHYLLLHEYVVEDGANDMCIGWYYHAYRACNKVGIARPQILIGEFGFDFPGWKAVRRIQELRDEDYAQKLIAIWNKVYAPDGIKAACIFAWGKGDRWENYDVSDAGAFLTALKAASLAEPASLPPIASNPDTPPSADTPAPETPPVAPEPGTPTLPDMETRLVALERSLGKLQARVDVLEAGHRRLTSGLDSLARELELPF